MTKQDIQNDIHRLDEIKVMVDAIVTTEDGNQNDDALVSVLDSEYKLSAKTKKDILALVSGKKLKVKVESTNTKREQQNICGECFKVGVNFNGKDGKGFVGYEVLKKRIAQKKNQLSNKLK